MGVRKFQGPQNVENVKNFGDAEAGTADPVFIIHAGGGGRPTRRPDASPEFHFHPLHHTKALDN